MHRCYAAALFVYFDNYSVEADELADAHADDSLQATFHRSVEDHCVRRRILRWRGSMGRAVSLFLLVLLTAFRCSVAGARGRAAWVATILQPLPERTERVRVVELSWVALHDPRATRVLLELGRSWLCRISTSVRLTSARLTMLV